MSGLGRNREQPRRAAEDEQRYRPAEIMKMSSGLSENHKGEAGIAKMSSLGSIERRKS
jgi:hypothetical protein